MVVGNVPIESSFLDSVELHIAVYALARRHEKTAQQPVINRGRSRRWDWEVSRDAGGGVQYS